jgi:hypothetical protein
LAALLVQNVHTVCREFAGVTDFNYIEFCEELKILISSRQCIKDFITIKTVFSAGDETVGFTALIEG